MNEPKKPERIMTLRQKMAELSKNKTPHELLPESLAAFGLERAIRLEKKLGRPPTGLELADLNN